MKTAISKTIAEWFILEHTAENDFAKGWSKMDLLHIGSILAAFWITVALMLCHYLSPIITRIQWVNSRKITSFSGGVAVAYVFLHMLPSLVEGNQTIGKLLARTQTLSPLLDLGIFVIALFGFNIYFGLEILASRTKETDKFGKLQVYYLHLFMYGVYNFLITYTMPLRVQSGIFYAIIFTFAMGLHFIFMDRSFNRNFYAHFSVSGRLFLTFTLFFGWFITFITNPINTVVVSFMIAFLAGSILYTVFREELPASQSSSFISFTCGTLLITVILIALDIYR